MATKRKFMDDEKKKPICYENEYLIVYTNGRGEVFVLDKKSGTGIKIDKCSFLNGGLQFIISNGEHLDPFPVGESIAWRVVPKDPVPGQFDE
jgi:hypothetical protein